MGIVLALLYNNKKIIRIDLFIYLKACGIFWLFSLNQYTQGSLQHISYNKGFLTLRKTGKIN